MRKLRLDFLSNNLDVLDEKEMSEIKGGQNYYSSWSATLAAIDSGTSGPGVWYKPETDEWWKVDDGNNVYGSSGFTSYGASTTSYNSVYGNGSTDGYGGGSTGYQYTGGYATYGDYGSYGSYGGSYGSYGGSYGSYGGSNGEDVWTGKLKGYQEDFVITNSTTRQLDRYMNQYFGDFPNQTTDPSVSATEVVVGYLPSGYTMNQDGSYNKNGVTVYGVTWLDADGKPKVSISPYMLSQLNDDSRGGLVGHELIHAKHIEEHKALYQSNRAQFDKNSEYASYKYQRDWYNARGQTASAAQCQAQMNYFQQNGADTTWGSSYTDIP